VRVLTKKGLKREYSENFKNLSPAGFNRSSSQDNDAENFSIGKRGKPKGSFTSFNDKLASNVDG